MTYAFLALAGFIVGAVFGIRDRRSRTAPDWADFVVYMFIVAALGACVLVLGFKLENQKRGLHMTPTNIEHQEDSDEPLMDLWNTVCTTDEQYTRHCTAKGGFTAINAQYQLREATQIWGPYGERWGVRDLRWEEVRDEADHLLEVTLSATFYYPGLRGPAAFEISSDIAYRPGGDSRKKLLTDLTTKALSKLGFNADVFLGRFDDNKYVEDAAPSKPPAPRAEPRTQAPEPQPAPQPAAAAADPAKLKQDKAAAKQFAVTNGEWLDKETLRFGKFKGHPWRHLTLGAPDGERIGWLRWLAAKDPKVGPDGRPVDEKYLFGNLITQARAEECISMVEEAGDGDEFLKEPPF